MDLHQDATSPNTQHGNLGLAEKSFREAIAVASERRAKSWELRAAMSLARLLQSRGRQQEATGILEPLVNWFREGHETYDLRQACNLLASLN